jgi:hypothetical protein
MEVHYDKVHDILYIESMNSDGAGSYEVIWKIEKKESIREGRFLTNYKKHQEFVYEVSSRILVSPYRAQRTASSE